MNILFLTMVNFRSLSEHGIYEDLMREFVRKQHKVFVVAPTEKRNNENTAIIEKDANYTLLRVRTGNLQKTSFIKKGIATIRIAAQFKKAIKKHFCGNRFDLILYCTPPITLYGVVKYFKKRDKAKTFLLLKDIFLQNALDINILDDHGVKGIIYRYFRKREKNLYHLSDYIGCMSQANVDYLLSQNTEIDKKKVHIVPNSIEPIDVSLTSTEKAQIRDKYGIPHDKVIFVYGGNLGKPQGIPFITECLQLLKDNSKAYFLIVGDGTEFGVLQAFVHKNTTQNVKLLKRLPREDFDRMIAACDVGMIFLDHRFTIPNYPSRLLSYMQAELPVLACTDSNTDVGQDIADGGFGWWCESNDATAFAQHVEKICTISSEQMNAYKKKAKVVLLDKFTVAKTVESLLEVLRNEDKNEFGAKSAVCI